MRGIKNIEREKQKEKEMDKEGREWAESKRAKKIEKDRE